MAAFIAARIAASAPSVTGHCSAPAEEAHTKTAVSHEDIRRAARAPPFAMCACPSM
eukprot:CAMPEP_0185313250 /NCGR_PEP_ID=MMETSP1363-20130426/35103_1 /TAXON_ID=38817 /ORGANISM="Gephyrocapsa oceanica, Strain RCC1303" /LENGTH=55 /DNA_ID=CAMNT_0027911147 /DNA_START=220 /DNA_END=387 /DNA_ORIENTATION=+